MINILVSSVANFCLKLSLAGIMSEINPAACKGCRLALFLYEAVHELVEYETDLEADFVITRDYAQNKLHCHVRDVSCMGPENIKRCRGA